MDTVITILVTALVGILIGALGEYARSGTARAVMQLTISNEIAARGALGQEMQRLRQDLNNSCDGFRKRIGNVEKKVYGVEVLRTGELPRISGAVDEVSS